MRALKCLLFAVSILSAPSAARADEGIDYARERRMMVDSQIAARGITDKKVLEVVGRLERHKFVPEGMRRYAYEDVSLPIGNGEAVPPGYFVSLVAQLASLKGGERVLELGIESGYMAAVLAELSGEVYCVEPSEQLAAQTGQTLKASGYKNIQVRTGRTDSGWPEYAPYDVVVITNPTDFAPKLVIDQIRPGGRIIMPMKEYWGKKLIVMTKVPQKDGYKLTATLVTPVVGEIPSEQGIAAGMPEPETSKWETVKGSKWMKKK